MGLAVAMVESEEDGEGSKNGSGGDGSHGMKIIKINSNIICPNKKRLRALVSGDVALW